MPGGIITLRNDVTRASAARETSTAFSPGFFVTVSVTAGWPAPSPDGWPAAPLAAPAPAPGVYQT